MTRTNFSFFDTNVIFWQQVCHFPPALDLQSEYNIRFFLHWTKKNGYFKTDTSGFNYFYHLIKFGVTQCVRLWLQTKMCREFLRFIQLNLIHVCLYPFVAKSWQNCCQKIKVMSTKLKFVYVKSLFPVNWLSTWSPGEKPVLLFFFSRLSDISQPGS